MFLSNTDVSLAMLLLLSSQDLVVPEDFRVINTSRSISLINYESLNTLRLKLSDSTDSNTTK